MHNGREADMSYDEAGFVARVEFLKGDMTLASFETKCGFTAGFAHYLLKKHKKPSIDKIQAIISAFGCNGHWLLTGEGEPFSPTIEHKKSPPDISGGHSISEAQFLCSEAAADLISMITRAQLAVLRDELVAQGFLEIFRSMQQSIQNVSASPPDRPTS